MIKDLYERNMVFQVEEDESQPIWSHPWIENLGFFRTAEQDMIFITEAIQIPENDKEKNLKIML